MDHAHRVATNLVAGDTNGFSDVFGHDRASPATELLSVATGGAQADFHSYELSNALELTYVP